MNKVTSRASLLALVASASIFASAARAESTFVPEEPSGCLVGSLDEAIALKNKTPMCTYLTRCCNGNTDKRQQCCDAALKNGC